MSTTPVVLVTGALTGIGRAAAIAFAGQGATVVVSGRRPDAGEALVKELKDQGAADAAFIQADVRYDDEPRELVDGIVTRFGRLDVAVNNAGTEGKPGLVPDVTAEDFAAVYDTNVLGTLLSMKHELRVMRAQGGGNIINLSSIYGAKGFPGASLYVSSKHAIIGLTRSAALEAAVYGVRVNAVGPATSRRPCTRERLIPHRADDLPRRRCHRLVASPSRRVSGFRPRRLNVREQVVEHRSRAGRPRTRSAARRNNGIDTSPAALSLSS